MKLHILIIIASILTYMNGYTQEGKTTIIFDGSKTPVTRLQKGFAVLPITSRANNYHGKWEITKALPKPDKIIQTFYLKEATCLMLTDMFGHMVYVRPGDTVYIEIDSLPNNSFYIKPGISTPWSVNFTYTGSRKMVHGLFDSLTYVNGALYLNLFTPKSINFDLDKFIDSAETIRKLRLNFLNEYAQRHNLNGQVIDFAISEIEWSFAAMVMSTLKFYKAGYTKDKLSDRYLQVMNNFGFKPDIFFNQSFIQYKVMIDYLKYFAVPIDPEYSFTNTHLEGMAAFADSAYQPDVNRIIMGINLEEYLANGIVPTEKTMRYFEKSNPDKELTHTITTKRDSLISKKSDFGSVLNLSILNSSEKVLTIKMLTQNKPLLIDCWASWCKPYIDAFPLMEKWKQKYGDQIQFITLSFDNNKNQWKNGIAKYDLNKDDAYLLPTNFNSAFAQYFSINSIPRYILLNSSGKVICADCSTPENEESFEKYLLMSIGSK